MGHHVKMSRARFLVANTTFSFFAQARSKSDYYSPFVADLLSSHTFPPFHTFSTSYVLTQAMASSQQPLFTDEDCNLPSQERVALLKRLDHLLGDVPLHFWAACHLCDLQGLALLVKTAELNPNIVLIS